MSTFGFWVIKVGKLSTFGVCGDILKKLSSFWFFQVEICHRFRFWGRKLVILIKIGRVLGQNDVFQYIIVVFLVKICHYFDYLGQNGS